MARHNESMEQLIRHICGTARADKSRNAVVPLLNCVGNILKQIDKCSIRQARDFLEKALEATVSPLPLNLGCPTQVRTSTGR